MQWTFPSPTSSKPRYLHCNGTKVQQPKIRCQLIYMWFGVCKQIVAFYMIHFPETEKTPLSLVSLVDSFYLFLCQCNCWCWVVQLTLWRILCVASCQNCRAKLCTRALVAHSTRGFPDCQASAVQTCISCKFLKWFSYISARFCFVSPTLHCYVGYILQHGFLKCNIDLKKCWKQH